MQRDADIYILIHIRKHTNSIADKQVQTLIIMRAGFYQSMTFLFPPPSHRNATLHHFLLSSCLSTLHPFFLLLPVSLSPERHDAHAFVLSWSWPYWLSDVELIKDNLRGVSLPARGIKSWWRRDRPLIIILLLVRMGEIITLQAQSEGTLLLSLSVFPSIPARNLQFSFPATLPSFPLSISVSLSSSHSLTDFPAMLPSSATPLGTNSNSVHIFSLCTLTLPTNPDHHSILSSQHLSTVWVFAISVCWCYWIHVIYKQCLLVCICNAHKTLREQHFS